MIVEIILGEDPRFLTGQSHFVVQFFYALLVEVTLGEEDKALG